MKTVGIIAEYNPFHLAHADMISRARLDAGAEAVVCVMSGDFVQRGDAACYSKFARAKAAVRSGVDLVFELPLPWCLSSAEGFARGGVGLLASSGVVDIIAFGSECADRSKLTAVAEALDSPAFPALLKIELRKGASFARARENALVALLGEELRSVLSAPNDILGIEYARANAALPRAMELLPIERSGSAHDGAGSASALRKMLREGESIEERIPAGAYAVYREESAVFAEELEIALLSRLRALPREAFSRIPDAAEGLDALLYAACREEPCVDAILMRCKSKRYALARLRRMLLCAALGIEKGMNEGIPPYLRVLAANERGCELLAQMRASASLPVIVKSASVRRLSEEAQRVFSLGAAAHDLYVLAYREQNARRGGEDHRATPYIQRDGA